MATIDPREATEFVLSRMKVVFLVLLDDNPVGYLPDQKTAAAYAGRLALQKEKILSADSWADVCIEEKNGEFLVLRKSLGLVYDSPFTAYHTIKYLPLEVLDINNIIFQIFS